MKTRRRQRSQVVVALHCAHEAAPGQMIEMVGPSGDRAPYVAAREMSPGLLLSYGLSEFISARPIPV
jgi:hypothetical protein